MSSQYIGTGRLGATLATSFSSSASGTTTAGFNTGVRKARVVVTADSYIKISSAGTAATTADAYLPGLAAEYFTVSPGEKVSAIQVSSGGAYMNVTEIV